MPRPVHFEMNFQDIEKAKEFYGNVFGWTFTKYGDEAMPYWLTTTGPDGEMGINGGFMGRSRACRLPRSTRWASSP